MDRYPTRYTDLRGSESTTIVNDGETLRVEIRGWEFTGNDFDCLSPAADALSGFLEHFTFNQECLCSCRLECQIPLPVEDHGVRLEGTLAVELILGDPAPRGRIDREELRLTLSYGLDRFASPGTSGLFEEEMLAIQAQMPQGVFIKACINCMFSDYHPLGNGLFGMLLCFRNIKTEYIKVRGKREFWAVHNRFERQVQETYLCPEFERRVPGVGYRG